METSMKKVIKQEFLTGERALFASKDLRIEDTIFDDGESPLKESSDLEISGCMFKWKYPLWYCNNVSVKDSTWFENARAGVWYTNDIVIEDSMIEAPKNFRRCRNLSLSDVSIPNAAETLWHCENVSVKNVVAKGDYFGMNCKAMTIDNLEIYGNYCFDGARDITITNSKLLSKDAFWNCENVTVRNCFISGEYLGWNSKNLTFIGCTIESLQGLCYIDELVMKDCKLLNTTLAFEYSTVDADIKGKIDSVLNPSGGTIRADKIDKLIMEKDRVDPSLTRIIVEGEKTL